MNAPQSFDAWWLEFITDKRTFFAQLPDELKNGYREIARTAWANGQQSILAQHGARVVHVMDYIGSDDIPRRLVYATREAAARALARTNKRAMVNPETVHTF